MRISLVRKWFHDDCTLGEMQIYDKENKLLYSCYTLENKIGDYGKGCAIPAGNYRVILTFSNRFQKVLPLIIGVKNRTGIRIHAGNTSKDTTGCVLVGEQRGDTDLFRSRPALAWVLYYLQQANDNDEKIFIDITEAKNNDRA